MIAVPFKDRPTSVQSQVWISLVALKRVKVFVFVATSSQKDPRRFFMDIVFPTPPFESQAKTTRIFPVILVQYGQSSSDTCLRPLTGAETDSIPRDGMSRWLMSVARSVHSSWVSFTPSCIRSGSTRHFPGMVGGWCRKLIWILDHQQRPLLCSLQAL